MSRDLILAKFQNSQFISKINDKEKSKLVLKLIYKCEINFDLSISVGTSDKSYRLKKSFFFFFNLLFLIRQTMIN